MRSLATPRNSSMELYPFRSINSFRSPVNSFISSTPTPPLPFSVYKSQQKPEAGKADGTKDAKPNYKDNVVDADFEVIKKKEERKEKSA